MLKFQIALATLLICSIAFVSCGRVQDLLEPPADDTPTEMVMEMMAAHKSWDHVMLPAPTMTIPEAAAAMNPGGTGQAHGVGTRTVYFNEVGAMANRAGADYPVETMIVKEAMDPTNTFIKEIVTMMKVDTDDPMYAAYVAYNGWVYGATQRTSETDKSMPQTIPMEMAAPCHSCHVKASKTTDSVFVSLAPAVVMDDGTDADADMTAADTTAADTTAADTTAADTTAADTTAADTTAADTTAADTTAADTTAADTTAADTTAADTTAADTTAADTTAADTTAADTTAADTTAADTTAADTTAADTTVDDTDAGGTQ